MAWFKRKPECIEAFQWEGEGTDIPDWAKIRKIGDVFLVKTSRGEYALHEGMWVCRQPLGIPYDSIFVMSVSEMRSRWEEASDRDRVAVPPGIPVEEVFGTWRR